jgi:hypothetical protein
MTRTAKALCSVVVCSVLAGCGMDPGLPPKDEDIVEAMQVYIGDREGTTDSKGRYRGPRVRKVEELKCAQLNEKEQVYKCSFKYTVMRRGPESELGELQFRKVPAKVEEKGKEVEKLRWRVAA